MSRLPTPGSDDGTWGGILNDFLSVSLDTDGTIKAGAVAGKANDSAVVHNTGNETVGGIKTFTSSPVVPTPGAGNDAANKTYVDSAVTAGAPDATTSSKGLVQLAGDLGGTAAAPTVPGLSAKEAVANKGAASGYAPLDGSSLLPLANLPHHASTHAPNGSDPIQPALMLPPFTQGGSLSVTTGTIRLPIDSTYNVTGVRLMAGTAPAGASIIIDILKNGSTIFTTSGNRPTIGAGANAGGPGAAPDVPGLAAGDYLTVNIAQVGSTTPGADLVVTILAQRLA